MNIINVRNILVIGQRKTGVELDETLYTNLSTPEQCIESQIEIEGYALQLFTDDDVNIEYLSHFPKETGSADYNMLFGGKSQKSKKFINEKTGHYDLIIIYGAPFVSFIMDISMVHDLHKVMKPNGLISLFQLQENVPKYWSFMDFQHFNRKFQRFPSVDNELLYIK